MKVIKNTLVLIFSFLILEIGSVLAFSADPAETETPAPAAGRSLVPPPPAPLEGNDLRDVLPSPGTELPATQLPGLPEPAEETPGPLPATTLPGLPEPAEEAPVPATRLPGLPEPAEEAPAAPPTTTLPEPPAEPSEPTTPDSPADTQESANPDILEESPYRLEPVPIENGDTVNAAPLPTERAIRDDWESCLPEGAADSLTYGYGSECEPSLCGPPGRFWLRTDYLLWWTNGSHLPPLLTTSDQDDNGILGAATTEILFGDQRVNDRARHNVRFSGGWWMDPFQRRGFEFDVYSLGRISTNYSNTSTGEPLLARPFYDVLLQRQNSEYVAMRRPDPQYPTNIYNIQGTFRGHADEDFRSLGVRGRWNLYTGGAVCLPGRARTYDECCAEVCCEPPRRRLFDCFRVDFIGGYRQYNLDDNVNAEQDVTVVRDPRGQVADGTRFRALDHFHCRNDFNGGELGLITQFHRDRWSLEFGAKLSLGSNSRAVSIRGNTLITHPGGETATLNYGLLTSPTNIGRYVSDDFAAIPEFNLDLAYQLNGHWRIHVGYTFLYWANIVRSAEQIDLGINTSYLNYYETEEPHGPRRPSFDWKQGTFWAQGLNLGLEARW